MTALALHSSDIVYYQRFHTAVGLNEIDKLGTDYNGLATDLLELLFKREMLTPLYSKQREDALESRAVEGNKT